MSERTTTRRRFLQASTGALAVATVPAAASATDSGWTVAETPTGNTLHDVAYTTNGAYTVGGGGIVLRRADEGWRKVLDGGPTGNGNSLFGSDTTDDDERLWFVGASGAIGEYDVTTGNLEDHSAPNDNTNNYNDVAVTGPAGEANVYVAGDSGKIYYSFENGESQTWEYVTPGSGSAIKAIDFHDARTGHAVDTNGKVFETTDGETWEPIGLQDANVNFYGVDSDARDSDVVSGGGGMVFDYDGAEWTPTDLDDAGLKDVEVEGDRGLTVGGGGKVFAQSGGRWSQEDTPTGENLKAVARGDPDLAVGAGGTVIER